MTGTARTATIRPVNPKERRQAQQIGKRITQARLETGGMTQKELGELLGVTERSVSAYETGEVVPYARMERLSEILGRPIPWFLYGQSAIPDESEIAQLRREFREIASLLRQMADEVHRIAEHNS